MTIKELMLESPRVYLAWIAQKPTITNRDMVEQLMRRAMNSRNADEVNDIEKYANAYLADLYIQGKKVYCFTDSETKYNSVTLLLPSIKNGRWIDFNNDLLQTERNCLDMLNGDLNRLCISNSKTERFEQFTAALYYVRRIVGISRERALEAEYGTKAERDAQMAAQLTAMFAD